jgi:alpha-ribazole phosphatase
MTAGLTPPQAERRARRVVAARSAAGRDQFGLWEGRPGRDSAREIDAWAADVGGYAPPGGESPGQLQVRVLDFFNRLPEQDAVIVTHAGVIRSLLAADQGLPPERWCDLACDHASLTVWQR